jgi:hypothetical protein
MNPVFLNIFRKRRVLLFITLAGYFFLVTSCITIPARVEKESWFLSAKDYVNGCERVWKFGSTDEEKTLFGMAQIERAKENYLNSRQPTIEEILAVLNANEDEKTKVGLGAMALRPVPEYDVVKKIISFLKHPSHTHRVFACTALVKIHRNEIKKFQDIGDMIFDDVKTTSDIWVLSYGIEILGKFNNPKYLPFIVEHLKKHDSELLYYSSFKALKEMDEKYSRQVRKQLESEGDTETLKNLNRTDDFWRKWHRVPDQAPVVQ